jgi:hypothetical protein
MYLKMNQVEARVTARRNGIGYVFGICIFIYSQIYNTSQTLMIHMNIQDQFTHPHPQAALFISINSKKRHS